MLESAIILAQECRPGMRPDWAKIVHERSAKQWANDISEITQDRLKHLLARANPPTFEELERLGYLETDLMGVYLSSIRQVDGEGRKYLYIGSASSDRGLKHRLAQHRNKVYSKREAWVIIILRQLIIHS
jgi:hypothetical protein